MSDVPDQSRSDPRFNIAFPTLTDEQIGKLEPFGKQLHLKPGEMVWRAGQPNVCMFVVREGEMTILDERTGNYIATHHKGGFSGDVDVLSGRPSIVSAIAKTDLVLLEIPSDEVRSMVGQHPELGDLILRAFLIRRSMLQERGDLGVLVFGSRYSPDALRIREFLIRNRYPVHWEDLETNPATRETLREFHVDESQTPVVVLQSGEILKIPSNEELAQRLGVSRSIEDRVYDLVIIGAGPAGLAAGVYGASEGLDTLVLDNQGPGGQAGTSSRIENYVGFPTGLSGQDLADRAVVQAERFGAQLYVPAQVEGVSCGQRGLHEVKLSSGDVVNTKCVILATGASYRKLDIPEQERFEGRGLYYAATNVERLLCSEEAVAVVGAGNSAGQAAVFMSERSKRVVLVVRGDSLRTTMSSYLALRIESSEKISVLLNSEICQLGGSDYLQSITIRDPTSGQSREEVVSGLFVMIGAVPHTEWLPEPIACDGKGFILTGQQVVQENAWKLSRPPFFLETSCPGVFAAGDARAGSVKRVASAVGEGSMAVAFVHQFLAI